IKEIKKRHEKGQPLLVGTRSVEKNEYLGKLLDIEGVPHQILNAKYHEKEGEIIAQAGRVGQVTIATNMAGRGVDIILGGNPQNDPEQSRRVRESGGLHIIGTERHDARRIDNQLRGRTGRQGDPGSTQFFVSLEDDLMRIFGGDRIKSLMGFLKIPEDEPIQAGILSKSLEEAQSKIEGFNFDARKHVLEYDNVLNKHREVIYKKRREVLEFSSAAAEASADKQNLRSQILELVKKAGFTEGDYEKREKELGLENMRQVEKIISLRVLDTLWLEHLENMEYLRDSVRLRAYGQQDPLVEYKNEGHKAFQALLQNFESQAANTIMKAQVTSQPKTPEFAKSAAAPPQGEVGRNDPCPCGAKHPDGRPIKFKHCHGK
ncbi:MAG: preprotein translocase subunit SecA, partial [bacterium]